MTINCCWALYCSLLLAEGQLHRSLGQRPRWVFVVALRRVTANTPQPTALHPNTSLRLVEVQPQPNVAFWKGRLRSNSLTSATASMPADAFTPAKSSSVAEVRLAYSQPGSLVG
jgi:hypothetical protein